MNGRRAWSLVVLALIPLVLSAATYFPIIHNYFFLDDFLNLFRIENSGFWEYLLTPHGGHVLLVRNALFYLSAKLLGPEPSYFFWIVLLTHLLNVFLLFSTIHSLTGSARLACLGATLWGTSPVNEGTLGWYAVYGQVVVATAYLPILMQAARLARSGEQPSRARRLLWILLTLIGSASFGVGLGLAMSLPFVLLLILRPERRTWLPPLASILLLVPVFYVGSHWAYTVLFGTPIPAALTDLLHSSWLRIAMMLFDLIAYGAVQVALGFYAMKPDAFVSTISYASMALLGMSTLIALARASASGRRQILACLLMVTACYGTIAVGRAGFLPGLPIVTVATQPRYHYVGFVVLTLLLCVILANSARGFARPAVKNVLLLSSLALIGTGFVWKRPAIDHHDAARRSTRFALHWIEARIDKAPPGEVVYFFNKIFEAVPPYWMPPSQFPGWAAVYVIFYPENSVDGKPVRFVQRGGKIAGDRGRRTSSLIIDLQTWQREKENAPAARTGTKRQRHGGTETKVF